MNLPAPASQSMRLFYALWPDDATRSALQRLQMLVDGRHTRYSNLHVTLAFLGEQPVAHLPVLKAILAGLPRTEILLQIDRLGYFPKSRIAWAGTHAVPDSLLALQASLTQALQQHEIGFDQKATFTPHVTLSRDAGVPLDRPFHPIIWPAEQVALVQSMQQGGVLAYQVLAQRCLRDPALP